MSQFAVIGLGSFGSALASKLVENGCEVLALDKSEQAVEAVQDLVQTAVIGDVTVRRTLEVLPLRDMDAVIISLGDHMDAAILAALYLRELGVEHIWAKAINEDHAKILAALGVERAILPEREMAARLATELSYPNALDYLKLPPEYHITEVRPRREFVGKSLSQLNLASRFNVQVIAVHGPERADVHMAPDGSYVIQEHDVLVVLGKAKGIDQLRGEMDQKVGKTQ